MTGSAGLQMSVDTTHGELQSQKEALLVIITIIITSETTQNVAANSPFIMYWKNKQKQNSDLCFWHDEHGVTASQS